MLIKSLYDIESFGAEQEFSAHSEADKIASKMLHPDYSLEMLWFTNNVKQPDNQCISLIHVNSLGKILDKDNGLKVTIQSHFKGARRKINKTQFHDQSSVLVVSGTSLAIL